MDLEVLSSTDHNHGSDDSVLKHDKAREGIYKKEHSSRSDLRSEESLFAHVRDCREEDVEDTPLYYRLKSSLKRARQSLMPPLPTAIEDVRQYNYFIAFTIMNRERVVTQR